jgi:radical S-adenosyl methionine domain-containing protein 2
MRHVLTLLREAGTEKITFVGGEPTLHPHITECVAHAHVVGLTTSLVTNGARLSRVLDTHAHVLDWVSLSVDSGNENTPRRMGHGKGDPVRCSEALFALCREKGVRTKLNTVVTQLNWEEDMRDFVGRVRPDR